MARIEITDVQRKADEAAARTETFFSRHPDRKPMTKKQQRELMAARKTRNPEVLLDLPNQISFSVEPSDETDLGVRANVTLSRDAGGANAYRIESVTVDTPYFDGERSVESTLLRKLPVTAWASEAVLEVLVRQHPTELGVRVADEPIDPSITDQGPTDEALRAFAGLYRAAVVAGVPPVKFICSYLGFGRPKAANWVKRARALGYIAETSQGRVSE